MILNTFTRKDRRNWYIQFSDPETGRRRVLVTPVRKGEADAKLKLAKIKIQLQEKFERLQGESPDDEQDGWGWAAAWISERYRTKRASLVKHRNQWNYLAAFFNENDVHGPGAVRRDLAIAYIAWRGNQLKEKSKRGAGRNTALADLRWAGSLLREAVARGIITSNPWEKLGFEREESKVRPELTDREIALIRQELLTRPDWMQVSFEIALHTGLRFAETRVALADIDFKRRSMLIAAPKGGGGRAYSIPIPSSLVGLLERLDAEGNSHTWTAPADDRVMSGLRWSRFFREIGLRDVCFHCTRVTFISRGARAGIPEHVMRRLVNHASSAVHRIYQRVTMQDVAMFVDLVPIPHASRARPDTRHAKPSPRPAADPASAIHGRRSIRSQSAPRARAG